MNDQILFCVQCDEPFTFSRNDQERFQQRGFDPPQRCSACRQHKVKIDGIQGGRWDRCKGKSRRHRTRENDIHWQLTNVI